MIDIALIEAHLSFVFPWADKVDYRLMNKAGDAHNPDQPWLWYQIQLADHHVQNECRLSSPSKVEIMKSINSSANESANAMLMLMRNVTGKVRIIAIS